MSSPDTVKYTRGLIGTLVCLYGVAAIVVPAIYGLGETTGLDGEFVGLTANLTNTEGLLDESSTSVSSLSSSESSSSSSSSLSSSDSVAHAGPAFTEGPITGEFFTTLPTWLFVWGLTTVAGIIFAGITMILPEKPMIIRQGMQFLAVLTLFFAWFIWVVFGTIMLMRRFHGLPGTSMDTVIYAMSWAACAVAYLVWFYYFYMLAYDVELMKQVVGIMSKGQAGLMISPVESSIVKAFAKEQVALLGDDAVEKKASRYQKAY